MITNFPLSVGRADTTHAGWSLDGKAQTTTVCGTVSSRYNGNKFYDGSAEVTCSKCIKRLPNLVANDRIKL